LKEHRRSTTRKNIIIALLLLVSANIFMGIAMALQTRIAMKTPIHQRMLDISNTAAAMLNGNAMKNLSADDIGTENYENAMQTLRTFQENIELEYIYAINVEENHKFTFSVDPTLDVPGEFGSPVVITEALLKAAQGIPSVDEEAYEDDWGRFYSAYSPVYDSDWNVPVIVAVDFSAEWFEKQVARRVITVIIISAVSLILGIILALFISSRSRKRFHELNAEMNELENGFKELNQVMMKTSLHKLNLIHDDNKRKLLKTLASGEIYGNPDEGDEISEIGNNLHTMQDELRRYIAFLNSQTYTDALTGVGNKSAYQMIVRELDQRIAEKNVRTAEFVIAVFDINELEAINTNYGFEMGDKLLIAAAELLSQIFQEENVYRMLSDEFIVILERKTLQETEAMFSELEKNIQAYNKENPKSPRLTLSMGAEVYREENKTYRQVFVKAEAKMRENKKAYYDSKAPKADF